MFYKKGVPRNFTKFIEKHLCQSLFLIKLQASRPWRRCFPVNFVKFLYSFSYRTPPVAAFIELREKYNVSTSATCFISEKLGHIVEQDRNMFANKILKVLHKDENFVQSYELRMTVHMISPFLKACQKFTGQKSLPI